MFIVLTLILGLVVIAIYQLPDSNLHIVACDVGQGDATLLIYKNLQVLVDGGPDKKVLNCLGKFLPFWDREIELVILTHPDGDHFMGLVDVFKRYNVDSYMYNPIEISKPEYGLLKNVSKNPIYPKRGQTIRLGMIRLDILAPLEQLATNNLQFTNEKEVAEDKTNDYSIVSLVTFGNFRGLLTGDMPPNISDSLSESWTFGPVNYIKVPHHGSRNGLTQNLLEKIVAGGPYRSETYGVISVGKNNRWGFPVGEILKMLKENNVEILRTDEMGDIEIITDGTREELKGRD
jgi:competence protein ComEC